MKKIELNQTMDAGRWAQEFVRINGGDVDLMQTWFANAIMTGYDHHYWESKEYKNSIKRAVRQNAVWEAIKPLVNNIFVLNRKNQCKPNTK